ncbi:hypothetical protein P692DRAFT_20228235 [Suillus brevipes Sb2]|nr:hypothetical protein P692DRAFT_20228235 [Suillus brevipes Sb2]
MIDVMHHSESASFYTNHIFVRRPNITPLPMMRRIYAMPQDGPWSVRVIEGAVMPRACPARSMIILFHSEPFDYCEPATGTHRIALEVSCLYC